MSNVLFANQDRLKTIGRYLIYDKVVSANFHNSELVQEVVYKGKRYKVKVKVTKIKGEVKMNSLKLNKMEDKKCQKMNGTK